jgi:hypothetical protein
VEIQIHEPLLAPFERFGEHVRRDYGILDGVVDPDPADRAHHVGGVPDKEQPPPVPERKAARLDREQRYLLPVLKVLGATRELRYQLGEAPP